jgi:hypothetical protein
MERFKTLEESKLLGEKFGAFYACRGRASVRKNKKDRRLSSRRSADNFSGRG